MHIRRLYPSSLLRGRLTGIVAGLFMLLVVLGLSTTRQHIASAERSATDSVRVAQPITIDPIYYDYTSLRAAFNLASTCEVDLTGIDVLIRGGMHANGYLRISATGYIEGPLSYYSALLLGAAQPIHEEPYQTDAPYTDPLDYNIADYAPGGAKALEAGTNYYSYTGDCAGSAVEAWFDSHKTGDMFDAGLYYTNCDISKIVGSFYQAQGTITVVSSETMHIDGDQMHLASYMDGLLFFSNGGSDACSHDAILVSGNDNQYTGDFYTPHGQLKFSAAHSAANACLVGYDVDISGASSTIYCDIVAHLSSLTVTTTADSGPGSLRQAILDANTAPGQDIIAFDIPGPGPHTIQPLSALPDITDPVLIDGTTQPGASCDSWPPTLMIEIDGSLAGSYVDGLRITGGNTTVRGLVINRFDGSDENGLITLLGVPVTARSAISWAQMSPVCRRFQQLTIRLSWSGIPARTSSVPTATVPTMRTSAT